MANFIFKSIPFEAITLYKINYVQEIGTNKVYIDFNQIYPAIFPSAQ